MKNVFIIGNGFDLDLQMRTKFSDFASSSDWPSDKSHLCAFLEKQRGKEKWFDLEACLLEYISSESTHCPSPNYTFEIKQDKEFFAKLCQSLMTYINNEQIRFSGIPKESVAKKVLKAIVENGYYQSIYSFNYTDLKYLANQMCIPFNLEYRHLHGSIEDGNIILGVNDRSIRKEYLEFRKGNNPTYHPYDLTDNLMGAHEIVIFGLSFGNIDFCYLKDFFYSLNNETNRSKRNKRWLTIFTYNEQSRLDIIENLESEGIMMSALASSSNINFICTNEGNDKMKLDDFLARQSIQSKEYINKKCFDALRF